MQISTRQLHLANRADSFSLFTFSRMVVERVRKCSDSSASSQLAIEGPSIGLMAFIIRLHGIRPNYKNKPGVKYADHSCNLSKQGPITLMNR